MYTKIIQNPKIPIIFKKQFDIEFLQYNIIKYIFKFYIIWQIKNFLNFANNFCEKNINIKKYYF